MNKEISVVLDEKSNQLVVSSLQVAEDFEKLHKDVLKGIEKHIDDLELTGEKVRWFYETTYVDKKGEPRKMYLMNRDGFSLLVMSFNNTKKVLNWKIKYIEAFNKMESQLRYGQPKLPKPKKDRTLASVNNAVKIMMPLLQNAGCAPEIQLLTAKTIYEQAGISFPVLIKADDEYLECDKIAAKLGVYAISGKPHGKAIAAIIRKLPISENDYTETWESNAHWQGTVRKYNSKVYTMIEQWLIDNRYPPQIESVNAKGKVVRYKVRYNSKTAVGALQMA